jgi:hypothetical protein
MPVTLTDEQVQSLREFAAEAQRNKGIADMMNGIYGDPALGQEARALIKKKYPNLPIPDYDTKNEINARLDREKQERLDAEKAAKDKAADEKFREQRADTQKKFGFTDDAMGRLEKLMMERNIGDYEAAATFMASKEPQPSDDQTGFDRHFYRHDQDETFKQIADDPEGWARTELIKAVRSDARARNAR